MNPSKSLIAIFCLILFISCEKDANLHISDYQYFPLSVGQYQIYEVTEALYSISNEPIHSKYFLKEQISESYENPASEKIYKIERLKRQTNAEPWKIDSVWTTQLLTNKAIRTENNINIVKLYFPIQTAQFWNKNELNNYTAHKISYQDKGKDFRIDTKVYQNTVSVIIKNDSSLLSKNKYLEVYAPLFGLIYQENISVAYCQSTPACIGKGLIEYGSEQKIKLIEMGQDK